MRCDECKWWESTFKATGECIKTRLTIINSGGGVQHKTISKGLFTGAAWTCADFVPLKELNYVRERGA